MMNKKGLIYKKICAKNCGTFQRQKVFSHYFPNILHKTINQQKIIKFLKLNKFECIIGNASCKLFFQNINQKIHSFCIVVQKLYARTIYDRFIQPNTLNVFTNDKESTYIQYII